MNAIPNNLITNAITLIMAGYNFSITVKKNKQTKKSTDPTLRRLL